MTAGSPQVLEGLRVLDLGHALAAPFAATMLSDFGAEVIKIERPGRGDPMRNLGPRKDDVALWWKAAARNKKSVTLDFTTPRGKELMLDLVRAADVVVENFRPGTLDRHGLGWEHLREVNPRLVMLSISGFGQTGPHRRRPGFGRTAEAMSGASQLTGFPDGPPVHAGYSLADTLAGLTGAYGVLLALLGRERDGAGDHIDVALYEPLFRLIDWQVIVYDQLGIVPVRAGNEFPAALEGVAAGVARTSDGVWMCYSAATDSVLARLVRLALGPAALEDPRFADAEARRRHSAIVQDAVSAWIAEHPQDQVERAFAENDAVIGAVYDAERIWNDPAFRQRENIVAVADEDCGELAMHGIVPKLRGRPGAVRWTGRKLGEQTAEVLAALAGVDAAELRRLADEGVV
ncbi:MAG: CoA transferase [Actinobacteria bacterium]|nr:CoA transferase [Actinomycetota bacterium]